MSEIPRPRAPSDELFETIARSLEAQGYCVLPDALPTTLTETLVAAIAELEAQDFRRARTGRGELQQLNPFVRRDKIYWIDKATEHAQAWLDWSDDLKTYLNRRLFLGLQYFESHFAVYEPGAFYKKHVDAFKGEENRKISLVVYLNKGWEPGQGGELTIFNDEGEELLKVTPSFATIAVFLSEEFPHEVLPTSRERYSVAGWFRLKSPSLPDLSPANIGTQSFNT